MKISIIIVTYNSQSLISDCLQSILDYADISLDEIEIIVVDNSSGENAEELKSMVDNHSVAKKIKTKYIHNVANLGYGQGNNIGIFNSTGDIVCIMNPDVRFGSSILQDVLLKFENNKKLAILGYKQLGGFNYSFYPKPEYRTMFSDFWAKFYNKIDVFNSKKHYLSGAFFFIDKKKFKEVGNFDENIFMYYEEPDIANRLQQKGYTIIYDKSKIYYHLVGNRLEWSEVSFTREKNSLVYYLDKFKFNKRTHFRKLIREIKIKKIIINLLGDNIRKHKFEQEIKVLTENYLKKI